MGLLKTENKNGTSALQGLKEEVGQNPTLSRNGRFLRNESGPPPITNI